MSSKKKSTQDRINATWDRLEEWLKQNWPKGLKTLNAGAGEKDLERLKNTFEGELPESFVHFLKRHNGQKRDSEALFPMGSLLSIKDILAEYKVWMDLLHSGDFGTNESAADARVRPVWFHNKWLPITSNGGGDNLCLDTAPTDQGSFGQLITLWHDDDVREPIYDGGFEDFFEAYVTDLEKGLYHYSADEGGIAEVANDEDDAAVDETDAFMDEALDAASARLLDARAISDAEPVIVENGLAPKDVQKLLGTAQKRAREIGVKTNRGYYQVLMTYFLINSADTVINVPLFKLGGDADEMMAAVFEGLLEGLEEAD